MEINKTGYYILNLILFLSIIVGYYEFLPAKTLVGIFIIPAFIISASLQYGKKKQSEKPVDDKK